MNKKFIIPILFASLVFVSCKKEITKRTIDVKYPETPKKAVIDTLFGTAVVDNYRWLEDDRSEETENWVKAENEVTFDYLSKIPYRDQLKERLSELWNYEKVGTPFIEGKHTYFYKNNGLQNQFVVYRKKGDAEPEVFLDPNTFADDATTSLGSLSFSKDGKTTAYAISEGEPWILPVRTATNAVDQRSRIIDEVNALRDNSLDYYAAVRSSYYQNRKAAIINNDDNAQTPLPLISIEFE